MARAPGMDLDHARLHQLEQSVEIVDRQHRLRSRRHRRASWRRSDPAHGCLAKKHFSLVPDGAANEAQHAAGDVRQDPIGDVGVEIRQPLLGDAVLGPEDALGVRESHAGLVWACDRSSRRAFAAASRTISSAACRRAGP